jgi:tetratricopeptide (TPR) repeat protein
MRRISLYLLSGFFTVLIAAFASAAQAEILPATADIRQLLPFETVSSQMLLPPDQAAAYREWGFERVTVLLENNQAVEALNDTYLMAIRQPELRDSPYYLLLLAEVYYRLGAERPRIHLELAKPLYERLMRRLPQWENQPLVAYRLATIYDRLGFAAEAVAHYGLLIDWYPDDPLAGRARLGLVMTSLREGEMADTESQARAVLATSKDAQIRYHATLCLAIARHRTNRHDEAAADFRRVINWPEDLPLLLDFELFAFGETLLNVGEIERGREVLLDYLKEHPYGADRAPAILYLADLARDRGDFGEAVTGYEYLIENHASERPGVMAGLRTAAMRLEAAPDQADPDAEKLLLLAYHQSAYFDLGQEAALALGAYYLRTAQPLLSISLGAGVYDNPTDRGYRVRAAELIAAAFGDFVRLEGDNPTLVATVFDRYAKYMAADSLSEDTFARLSDALFDNLQLTTLTELASGRVLAHKYPRVSAFQIARAEWVQGNADLAVSHLERLVKLPVMESDGKPAKKGGPDALRFAARLLWARILEDAGRNRDAMQQIAVARPDASDKIAEGRLELAAGRLLALDNSYAAAAERLANAARLLGPGVDEKPLRDWQNEAALGLGESLYQARRYEEAERVLASLLERKPGDPAESMAKIRLAQVVTARGARLPELPGHKADDKPPTEFWPHGAWAIEDYLLWRQANEKKFVDEPAWETL